MPTESREESAGFGETIESPKPIPERKIRKTLPHRDSLRLEKVEKAPKNEETSKRKGLRRTQSLMNLKIEPQDNEILGASESKRKKKKEHSTKISLKEYLPTHKAEKKLERQKSQGNLRALESETPSVNRLTNPFKKLTRSLSDRDLKRKSDVPLNESVITITLNEFKEQGIINWTRNGNTISATKENDPNVHLTIHTHDKSDQLWSEREEIVTDFLEFSSECNDDLKETINQIGKKNHAKK